MQTPFATFAFVFGPSASLGRIQRVDAQPVRWHRTAVSTGCPSLEQFLWWSPQRKTPTRCEGRRPPQLIRRPLLRKRALHPRLRLRSASPNSPPLVPRKAVRLPIPPQPRQTTCSASRAWCAYRLGAQLGCAQRTTRLPTVGGIPGRRSAPSRLVRAERWTLRSATLSAPSISRAPADAFESGRRVRVARVRAGTDLEPFSAPPSSRRSGMQSPVPVVRIRCRGQ